MVQKKTKQKRKCELSYLETDTQATCVEPQ